MRVIKGGADVAQGEDPILALLSSVGAGAEARALEQRCQCGKRLGSCGCRKSKASAAKRNGQ